MLVELFINSKKMKHIRFYFSLFIFLVYTSENLYAQDIDMEKYHRSSLYSVMLKHPEKLYCNEIIEAFKTIPLPEKYNNHDLKIKVFAAPLLKSMNKDEIEGAYKDAISKIISKNQIGGRLVEKWFNRNKTTGSFDMNLVAERGYYDASIMDINLARRSERGNAILADAGEELISNTFVLVNDIRYADGETIKDAVGGGLFAASYIANLLSAGLAGGIISQVSNTAGAFKKAAGFKVIVTSYLYRLDWNDEIANHFYSSLWVDNSFFDEKRKALWNTSMGDYKLNYIGCTSVFSGKVALGGVKSERDVFLKVCTRAIDKSISNLQKNFDEFKVFTPLISVDPLRAYIGLKEGVDEDSRYEVLEKSVDDMGRIKYKRVGEVKPEKDKIWDNRFMAEFDNEDGYDLQYTTFKKISGKNFYPGMLIREIK